jgi:hypothetical protein
VEGEGLLLVHLLDVRLRLEDDFFEQVVDLGADLDLAAEDGTDLLHLEGLVGKAALPDQVLVVFVVL